MRVSRILRNLPKSARQEGKEGPMSADHTLYHLEPTGFWKKFRDAVVVNPEISSGLPIPLSNRFPQPGSRTEKYATPATSASDPAFNSYYKRDTRRAYPQTSIITQTHLSSLLLSSPALASLPSPTTALEVPQNASAVSVQSATQAERAIITSDVPTLSSVLEKLPGKAYLGSGLTTGSGSGLPPLPPRIGKKWVPEKGDHIPHDEHAYFPMIAYK